MLSFDLASSLLLLKSATCCDKMGFSIFALTMAGVLVDVQIFNELNARKIHDEYNILDSILSSTIFIVIFFIIVGLQLLIMFTPLGSFFKVCSRSNFSLQDVQFGTLPPS